MPRLEDLPEVVVVDYDPRWPLRFEEEKARMVEALGDTVVAIEHVGSTAVAGLAAKPIIDIMVGIRKLHDGERCIEPLEALDYEYRGEAGIPGRLYFRKGEPRSHHLHMVEHGSEFWQRHILFRDLLRSDPKVSRRYGELKKELAIKYRADRLAYTEAKSPFIESVLARDAITLLEVFVVDYDPRWPARYEQERVRIVEALGGAVVAIEHVGSTAVPGLAAKPIIDIMVGIEKLADGASCVRPLEAIGYEYRGDGDIPGRHYFRKGNPRSHHLHMVERGGEFWERTLFFRDLLRERPDIAAEYGALKKQLAIKYRTQRLEYVEAKTPFIESALAQAREDRRPSANLRKGTPGR